VKKIITFNLSLLISLSISAQTDTLVKPGYSTIVTLVVDYQTYAFEGGNISYYSNIECNPDTLVLYHVREPSNDFGSITFTLSPSTDTIFYATIVWDGLGKISHPESFNNQYPFVYSGTSISKPSGINYYNENGYPLQDTDLMARADSAWESIDSLVIANLFSVYNFKAGIYFYPPAIGIFDPEEAKWIIFLYHCDPPNAVSINYENQTAVIFPNPAENRVCIQTSLSDYNSLYYEIINLQGISLTSGKIEQEHEPIDLFFLERGLYLFKILDTNRNLISVQNLVKY